MNTPIPEPILDQAIDWLVKLHSGENTQHTQQSCNHWRAENSLHEQAWQALQQTEQHFAQLNQINPQLALHTLVEQPKGFSRRQALKLLALFTVAAPCSYWIWKDQSWLGFTADIKTAIGEVETIQLSDGSELILNTNSAVDIDISEDSRSISLLKGELYLAINGNHRLPMRLYSQNYGIKSRNAQLVLRQQAEQSFLHLSHGNISIKHAEQDLLTLNAPSTYLLKAQGIMEAGALNHSPTAWTKQQLIVRQMPLKQLLTELNRYQRGWITYSDEIAALEVSGVFQLKQIDQAYIALANSLPIRFEQVTPFWVRFSAA